MRHRSTAAIAWLLATWIGTGAVAATPADDPHILPDVDVRGSAPLRQPAASQLGEAETLRARQSSLVLRWNLRSGSPQWISLRGARTLTEPSGDGFEQAARAFLADHGRLFNVSPRQVAEYVIGSVVPAADGGAHVYFVQRIAGLEVFEGRAAVNLRRDGAVRSVSSSLFAGAPQLRLPALDAAQAFRRAIDHTYPAAVPGEPVVQGDAADRLTRFSRGDFAHEPTARLVWFPRSETMRLAWEVRIAEAGRYTDYRVVLDAMTGNLLYRRNMTLYARVRALDGQIDPHADGLPPEQYRMLDLPGVTPESPEGWIDGAGGSLAGNNATSHLAYYNRPSLSQPDGIYDYPFNTPESALVNAWYWTNVFHDRTYRAGFDESAGNFQNDNFGNGGIGGDALQVVTWVAGFRNNAFYGRSVDGVPSSINMLFLDCEGCADRDEYPETGGDRQSSFDISTVFHEIAHGVTIRMVGGPADATCLSGTQSSAMGEGWSDLFASTVLDDPRDGDYMFEGSGWVRDRRHDLGYGALCTEGGGFCAPHDNGMIWAAALWEVRGSMKAFDPAGGVDDFERLVVEALKSTPCSTTMLDGRDALLQADTTLFAGANHALIWNAFASRGMGELASTTGDSDETPAADNTVPAAHVCSAPGAPTGLTAAPAGDNAVSLQYTADGATSAVEIWREDLDNPFDRVVPIASTNDLGTYTDVTVQGGKSYRYHVVALGSGGVTCRSAVSGTADATATGACESFPVLEPQTQAAISPSCGVTLSWNAAVDGCPGAGAPIHYNVYRDAFPGFEPGERNLVGRTAATTVDDIPPDDGAVYYYLVLAQHGDVTQPADHRRRGSSQVLDWETVIPSGARVLRNSWDFESGTQNWQAINFADPDGGWIRVEPTPTYYGGALMAPDTTPAPGGFAWVTGDSGSPASVGAEDSDGPVSLQSPQFNGTGGTKTILSFDYWNASPGFLGFSGLQIDIQLGFDTTSVLPIRHMTTQNFDSAGRAGWQRAEIDLQRYVTPTPAMRVSFVTQAISPFSEFGVDNVRVEVAGECTRSNLVIDSFVIDDSPAGWGNGNALLEPGETVYVKPTLRNDGGAVAVSPTGTLRTTTAGVVVHDGAATFADVAPAASVPVDGNGFMVSLPPRGTCGDTVTLDFEFVDQAGVRTLESETVETGVPSRQTVFTDDFETDKGWQTLDATAGQGVWQRGDPVGTLDGANPANPEDDSPNDAGEQCFVTENGPVAGDPNANDVDDIAVPFLVSPLIDLTGFKRADATFDLWFYDNSTTSTEDFARYGAQNDVDGDPARFFSGTEYFPTSGWQTRVFDLTHRVVMADDVRLQFGAVDQANPEFNQQDHVVEAGIDNVVVEGEIQACDPAGVFAPNGIAATLRVDRAGGDASLSWLAPPSDPGHDAAVYYEVYRSPQPDRGFAVIATPLGTSLADPLTGASAHYLVTAVNGGGTSGDEPAP